MGLAQLQNGLLTKNGSDGSVVFVGRAYRRALGFHMIARSRSVGIAFRRLSSPIVHCLCQCVRGWLLHVLAPSSGGRAYGRHGAGASGEKHGSLSVSSCSRRPDDIPRRPHL